MKVSCGLNFHLVDIISINLNVIVNKSLNYTFFMTNWICHINLEIRLKILIQVKALCPYPQ